MSRFEESKEDMGMGVGNEYRPELPARDPPPPRGSTAGHATAIMLYLISSVLVIITYAGHYAGSIGFLIVLEISNGTPLKRDTWGVCTLNNGNREMCMSFFAFLDWKEGTKEISETTMKIPMGVPLLAFLILAVTFLALVFYFFKPQSAGKYGLPGFLRGVKGFAIPILAFILLIIAVGLLGMEESKLVAIVNKKDNYGSKLTSKFGPGLYLYLVGGILAFVGQIMIKMKGLRGAGPTARSSA